MKERYEIIKKIYPDYLILFKVKDSIKCIGIDKELIELFGIENIKNTNKIILNNLDIEEKIEYKDNKYYLYYEKYRIIELLNKYRKEGNL